MMQPLFNWLDENTLLTSILVGASVVVFVGSIVLVPALIVRIPADYFAHEKRPRSPWAHQPAAVRIGIRLAKNVLGAILLIAGIIMLFVPGQGLLTMFMGFVLLDGPGKYRLERWLVSRRRIARAINWLRRRYHRPPLVQQDGTAVDHATD